MILKVATESKLLQEVYQEDEDIPPLGSRVFYNTNTGLKGGILWGYDTKSHKKDEKTLVYKEQTPVVNQSFIEAVKDAGDYYLFPAYTLLVKLLPDILFKTTTRSLKPKMDDTAFTDRTFKKILRLLKKRDVSLEEAYKKYKKEVIDFYIQKGFLEVKNTEEPLVKFKNINYEGSSGFLKKLNINIISGDYKKELYGILKGDFQSLVIVPSKNMFDAFENIIPDAVFLKSPNTPYDAIFCYESAMSKNHIFVATPFGLTLPFYNLKNIVLVDDMYTEGYKSKKEPYIDYRRLAYYVAKHYGANLYLVSETLSVNDYFLYKENKATYTHIDLKLPEIKVIEKNQKDILINDETIEIIKENLDKDILFYVNKSGYSYAFCKRCQALDTCVYCENYTTYFKSLNTIKCTRCGKVNHEGVCSRCGGPLITFGAGLEQYEEYITSMFGKRENFHFASSEKDGVYDIVFGFLLENMLFAPELSAREAYHHKLWSLASKARELFVIETTRKDEFALESLLKNNQLIFLEDELRKRELNNEPPFAKAIYIEMDESIKKLYQELLEEEFLYISKPRYFYEKGEKRFRLLIKVKTKANIKRLGQILRKYKNYKLHIGVEAFL